MKKEIIIFIVLYFYLCASVFLICLFGEVMVRFFYFMEFKSWSSVPYDFKGHAIKGVICGSACWLLSVIYRINGWDTGRKKK